MSERSEQTGREWARRGLIALGIWAAGVGFLWAAGLTPHLALIALAVAAGAAAFWLVADVGAIVRGAAWGVDSNAPPEGRGDDVRAERLQRDVSSLITSAEPDRVIGPLLVRLMADRVATTRGIDADTDPAGFVQAIGPELASYASTITSGRRAKYSARSLAHVVGRIEAL